MDHAIYTGQVYHGRHIPFTHDFRYNVFTLYTHIDKLDELQQKCRYFSYNKWNVLSLWDKDHGKRNGSEMRPWIENAAQKKGVDLRGGDIYLLAFPRLWGFVFNPISVFFCYSADKNLAGILYEVKNTFGAQHGYFLPVTKENKKSGKIQQSCKKELHVSPFIHMDCEYHFRLDEPDKNLNFAIHQFTKDGKILTATWNGTRAELTDKSIIKNVVRHPLMTFKVLAAIHWEAVRLMIKGARLLKSPPPPKEDVS